MPKLKKGKMMPMIRARFKTNSEDCRPLKVSDKFPWWCTGYDDDNAIIVAYEKDLKSLSNRWPEIEHYIDDVEFDIVNEIKYSSRFPKPDYIK